MGRTVGIASVYLAIGGLPVYEEIQEVAGERTFGVCVAINFLGGVFGGVIVECAVGVVELWVALRVSRVRVAIGGVLFGFRDAVAESGTRELIDGFPALEDGGVVAGGDAAKDCLRACNVGVKREGDILVGDVRDEIETGGVAGKEGSSKRRRGVAVEADVGETSVFVGTSALADVNTGIITSIFWACIHDIKNAGCIEGIGEHYKLEGRVEIFGREVSGVEAVVGFGPVEGAVAGDTVLDGGADGSFRRVR